MGPVQQKSTGIGPQVNRSNAGFPCAVVYGLLRALPGDRALLPPSRSRSLLLESLNASVGASGPHDFAVRDARARPSLTLRPPHPTATFVTCATPLLSGETRRLTSLICPTTEAKYFCAEGWTGFWRFARRVTLSQAGRADLTCGKGEAACSKSDCTRLSPEYYRRGLL
jgi:hypothetical protein